jgi:prevent-host-death family protein
MKTVPLAEVKANLSQLIDQVVKRDEQVLITRNGRPAAVLVSADEYDSLCETVAIRSDRELMAEIRRGLRGLKRGSKIYTLEELLPGYRVSADQQSGEGLSTLRARARLDPADVAS